MHALPTSALGTLLDSESLRIALASGADACAGSIGRLEFASGLKSITVETAGVYGEFTAALISEIGRPITEAKGGRYVTEAKAWFGDAVRQ